VKSQDGTSTILTGDIIRIILMHTWKEEHTTQTHGPIASFMQRGGYLQWLTKKVLSNESP